MLSVGGAMALTMAAGTAFAQGVQVEAQVEVQGDVQVVDQSQVPPVDQNGYPQQQQQQPQYGQQQPPPQQYGQQPQYAQPQYAQPQYAQPYAPQPRRHRIRYHEGMELPPGAEITNRVKLGMLIPGLAIFAVPYIITAMAYSISNDTGGGIDPTILIPVVGPFIQIPDASGSAARTGLAWDGILQTVGLVLFAVGVIPRKYVTYYAGVDGAQRFSLAPRFGPGGGGLDAAIRF
jgi:hypothetical protein